MKLHRYESVLWNQDIKLISNILSKKEFDFIICHDLILLPLAQRIKGKAKILFDAREYYPRHFEDRFIWRFLRQGMNHYLCSKYMKLSDYTITVSSGIAEEYKKNYATDAKVFQSWPPYHKLEPSKINPQKIRIIHHGFATPSRHIEEMIRMMDKMDKRFHLDLMLVNVYQKYFNFLINEAASRSNVSIIDTVTHENIIPFTHQYDIGIFLVPPSTFNLLHTLPNKFFEFIQARLAIAIGPSPDMQAIVEQYDLGVVARDFDPGTLAKALNRLDVEQVDYYKTQSNKAASVFNTDANCHNLNKILNSM